MRMSIDVRTGDVYSGCMRRTQIYLTNEQDQRLSALASERASSKAEVIRGILDAALDTGDADADGRAAILASAGICVDYPDWPAWLDRVRSGRGADARLAELGL